MISLNLSISSNESLVNREVTVTNTSHFHKAKLFAQKTIVASVIAGTLLCTPSAVEAKSQLLNTDPSFNQIRINRDTNLKQIRTIKGEDAVSVRETVDRSKQDYVVIEKIKNSKISAETIQQRPKIVYTIGNSLIDSFSYTALGGMSAWMEGILVKKSKCILSNCPIKKCTASVSKKNDTPIKVNQNFIDAGVKKVGFCTTTKKITASVRRVESGKKVYG